MLLPADRALKIKSLFQCRFIEQGLSFAGFSGRQKQQMLNALYLLQSAIYSLDKYGEETWCINGSNLAEYWEKIHQRLDLWGLSSVERSFLLRDMKSYQQVELDLRKRIPPTALPIDRFYYLKTCDVRLGRRLIAIHSPDGDKEELLYPLWACFDLAGEIYDDLTDVTEDMTTFNCNRFLIGYETQGAARTQKEYRQFLCTVEQRMRDVYNDRRGALEAEFIYKIFSKMVRDVNALLEYLDDQTQWLQSGGSRLLRADKELCVDSTLSPAGISDSQLYSPSVVLQ